ncbi:MAG TPA: hypothetical protein VFZ91_04460 [Allosphingosinicella sp.]
MYVRFITPWWRVRRGIDCGLFGPAYALARDREVPAVLREALWAEIVWFEDRLPTPSRFCVKSKRRWRPHGICWFVDDAREMIARAFALASLIGECGVPATKVATRRPGQILYRDPWQIVAKPEAATPTLWH